MIPKTGKKNVLSRKKETKKSKSNVSLYNSETTIKMHMLKNWKKELGAGNQGHFVLFIRKNSEKKWTKKTLQKEKLQKQKRIVNQLYYTSKNECL